MREIGTIAEEKDAKVLADHLLTLDISTRLVARADGAWSVWVHREDRVPEAREILQEFARNPADSRYQSSPQAAKSIRKQADQEDADYRKRVRDLRDRWEGPIYNRAPLTFALMLISIVVMALTNLNLGIRPPVASWLTFSVRTFNAEGFARDSGFEQIKAGQAWRLITPIFLHGNLPHLLFNMLALMAFGERIETRKGTARLALMVLVAAVASNVGEFAKSGGGFGGMSGVVFMMAGYLWAKGHADPEDHLTLDQRSASWMFAWFALGIVAGQMTPPDGHRTFPYNMANVAHGVGLASGILFGLLRF